MQEATPGNEQTINRLDFSCGLQAGMGFQVAGLNPLWPIPQHLFAYLVLICKSNFRISMFVCTGPIPGLWMLKSDIQAFGLQLPLSVSVSGIASRSSHQIQKFRNVRSFPYHQFCKKSKESGLRAFCGHGLSTLFDWCGSSLPNHRFC